MQSGAFAIWDEAPQQHTSNQGATVGLQSLPSFCGHRATEVFQKYIRYDLLAGKVNAKFKDESGIHIKRMQPLFVSPGETKDVGWIRIRKTHVLTTSFMTNPPSRPQCAVEGER